LDSKRFAGFGRLVGSVGSARTWTAVIVLAFVVGVSGSMGALPAEAQSGYRVCGAWNSSDVDGGIGTGLVVKVANGGSSTCAQKLQFMKASYGSAWKGSTAKESFSMITCEEFAAETLMQQASKIDDPCPGMQVNMIYRYYSGLDLVHPSTNPHVDPSSWHK